MTIKCPHCGFANNDNAKFCVDCGKPITEVPEVQEIAPEEVVEAAPEVASDVVEETEQAASDTADKAEAAVAEGAEETQEVGTEAQEAESDAVSAVDDAKDKAEEVADEVKEAAGEVTEKVEATADEAAETVETAAGDVAQKAESTADVAAKAAQAKAGELKEKFNAMPSKQKGIVAGVAAAVVVAIIALVVMLTGGPSDGTIESLLREGYSPSASYGNYTVESTPELKSVKVLSKEKETFTSNELQFVEGLGLDGNSIYDCQVQAEIASEAVETVKSGQVTVGKYQGDWVLVSGSISGLDTQSSKALVGVDQTKVIDNISYVLNEVGTSNSSTSLVSLYTDGEFEIVGENFDADAQTDTLEISCKKETDFEESSGTVTAVFSFGTSSWDISSATASDDILKVSHQKMVGTWTGTFSKESAPSFYGKCYGAKDAEVKVNITSVDDSSMKIEGTYTVTVHYHGTSQSDANSTDGDTVLSEESFILTADSTYTSGISFDYAGTYTRASDSNGKVEIGLGFGPYSSSDYASSDGVLIVSTTPEASKNSWGLATTFTDVFTLTKD